MKYAFLCQDITDTVVLAGEFIDKYMTKANGEFVKVYLYLLYHAKEDVTSADIANALNILESDAERAVAYWLSEGALRESDDIYAQGTQARRARESTSCVCNAK